MGKHEFAGGVKCEGCGAVVNTIYTPTQQAAALGHGRCEKCHAAAQEDLLKIALKGEAIEEAAEPEPALVIEYAGRAYDETVLAEQSPLQTTQDAVAAPSPPSVRGARKSKHSGKARAV